MAPFALPLWLVVTIGSLVVLFGLYRLRLALRSREEHERASARGGLYGYSRQRQLLYGLVYIVLGALLLAGAFGLRMPWQHDVAPQQPAGPHVIPVE
jgi:hypothetical protein